MFRCGIAYYRCRWIVPLLLLFAVIFDLIAVAAQSGWVEDENAKTHYASMWEECRGRNNKDWDCRTLMGFSWAQAVAALMIIGLLILIIAFIVSIVAMCNINTGLFVFTAVLLVIVAILQIIALIVYPVKFNERIFEGQYYYTWAYGFGWGATILSIGCAILFCCLPKYEEELENSGKPKYLYSSN